jgi:hypothetical protein
LIGEHIKSLDKELQTNESMSTSFKSEVAENDRRENNLRENKFRNNDLKEDLRTHSTTHILV